MPTPCERHPFPPILFRASSPNVSGRLVGLYAWLLESQLREGRLDAIATHRRPPKPTRGRSDAVPPELCLLVVVLATSMPALPLPERPAWLWSMRAHSSRLAATSGRARSVRACLQPRFRRVWTNTFPLYVCVSLIKKACTHNWIDLAGRRDHCCGPCLDLAFLSSLRCHSVSMSTCTTSRAARGSHCVRARFEFARNMRN